ncbi:LysM peptidoglycan-binding domain-containing protein [Rubritalea tangerina]|uniref:LysM peptidoglycan-binding domain-containing protein n=1 Tax=Rubritalea tangerina TaxID=430798 RepID=A0ABW4ZCL8_9BACT
MKTITLVLATAAASALVSCNNQSGNPYGAPAAAAPGQQGNNPYAVPQSNGETGNYAQNAPYQPLPGVGGTLPPTQPPAQGNNVYTPPPATQAAPVAGSTIPHTVQKGDSLWKLSRDYDTTVEAIQAANGISGNNIQIGQTLQIPNN